MDGLSDDVVVDRGFLYVIHLREFVNARQDVWKVGRTRELQRRLSQYPKGSRPIASNAVDYPVTAEAALLAALRLRFRCRRDIGAEYFECPLPDLLDVFDRVCRTYSGRTRPCHPEPSSEPRTEGPAAATPANPFARFARRACNSW